jgi:hypothetical protein
MDERTSFIFYKSFYESIKGLKKNEQSEIFKAICEFSFNKVEPDLKGYAKSVWILMRPNLEANYKKYENGKKQKGSKTEANDKQTVSKNEANVDVNVDGNVDENVKINNVDYNSGKWFKKVDANGFIEAVNKFLTDNANHNYPRILIEDFINHYTTPNENGGIRVNQFSSFGIQNKLYEMRTDVNRKDRYIIKPTSSIKTI